MNLLTTILLIGGGAAIWYLSKNQRDLGSLFQTSIDDVDVSFDGISPIIDVQLKFRNFTDFDIPVSNLQVTAETESNGEWVTLAGSDPVQDFEVPAGETVNQTIRIAPSLFDISYSILDRLQSGQKKIRVKDNASVYGFSISSQEIFEI